MVLFDMHVHTNHSTDGHSSLEELALTAIEKGLRGFALTDHCDMINYHESFWPGATQGESLDIAECYNEVISLRERFSGRVELLTGVEIGQPLEKPGCAAELLGKFPFDFVLCSLHNSPGVQDYSITDFSQLTEPELHGMLFALWDAFLDTIRWGQFDSLAHLTYPLRYMAGKYGRNLTPERHLDGIDSVLRALVDSGKALEINTSGLRQNYGRMMPDSWVVSRYRELGGELLTIGSDTHDAETLCAGFETAARAAAEAGFRHYTVYRERKPYFYEF